MLFRSQRNLAATCQWPILKQDLKQAGSRKQLLNFIKTGMAERAKIIPWTLTSPGVIIATFWDEDKSIKKEKEDKGKG